jgi:hypothetical protein
LFLQDVPKAGAAFDGAKIRIYREYRAQQRVFWGDWWFLALQQQVY